MEYVIPEYEATKIVDHIFIGSELTASNKKYLESLGVKYIMVVGSELTEKFPDDFVYYKIPILDTNEQYILDILDNAIKFLKDVQKENNGNILVHCKYGKSRSVAIVVAYIMNTRKINFNDAYDEVKIRRSQVKMNKLFQKQLNFWK